MRSILESFPGIHQHPVAIAPTEWPAEKQRAWQTLSQLSKKVVTQSLLGDIDNTPNRAEQFRLSCAPLTLDFNRNWLNTDVLTSLRQLLHHSGFDALRTQLKDGANLNFTENRPAKHPLLRASEAQLAQHPDGPGITSATQQLTHWVEKLRQGQHKGGSQQALTTLVNIGIGGSDLGPRMVYEALNPICRQNSLTKENPNPGQENPIQIRFVSNIDPADFHTTVADLDPNTTGFIICSKSFTTLETLENAHHATAWLKQSIKNTQPHFFAVTSAPQAAKSFGIDESQILPFWDWVGGRYSVWSTIGFSVAAAIGMEGFNAFKSGARIIDEHFFDAPIQQNMPATLALISVWYNHFFGAQSHAVIPYSAQLSKFPAYLQQLIMESNGKSINRQHQRLTHHSGQIVWGTAGTDSQHSYHQLLHQGTRLCPIDFLLPLENGFGTTKDHAQVVANCLAQAYALMAGSPEGSPETQAGSVAHHKFMPGNRPSNLIVFNKLTPQVLGALIALYEHKTFTESVIWDINPFDQWGVELGKTLGRSIFNRLQPNSPSTSHDQLDAATEYWITEAQSPNQKTRSKDPIKIIKSEQKL